MTPVCANKPVMKCWLVKYITPDFVHNSARYTGSSSYKESIYRFQCRVIMGPWICFGSRYSTCFLVTPCIFRFSDGKNGFLFKEQGLSNSQRQNVASLKVLWLCDEYHSTLLKLLVEDIWTGKNCCKVLRMYKTVWETLFDKTLVGKHGFPINLRFGRPPTQNNL